MALLAEYLFERYRPTLLLVHTQTSNQVPQEPDWRNPRRARSVAASDQIVSIILEVIERTKTWDTTAVIVTGDHGNTEVHTQLRPNIWLIEAGLRGKKLDPSAQDPQVITRSTGDLSRGATSAPRIALKISHRKRSNST